MKEEEVVTKTKIADLKPNMKKTIPTVEEIQQFVIDHGTEDFNTFGQMEGSFVGGILCQQVVDEIGPCIHYILSNNAQINSYLEVGAAAGGTITGKIRIRYRPVSIKPTWRVLCGSTIYSIVGPPINLSGKNEYYELKIKEAV